MKKNIVIISFFLTCTLHGQELIFKNYTLEDGFPSSEAHDSYQDAHGYMWFTTDKGLVRFDGEDFQVIDSQNGLPEDCVFNFFEQSPTRVWISTKSNQLFWFNPLARHYDFQPYSKNETLKNTFAEMDGNIFLRNVWIDKNHNLNCSFLSFIGFIQVSPAGQGTLKAQINWRLNSHTLSDFLLHYKIDSSRSYAFSEFIPRKNLSQKDPLVYLFNESTGDTICTDYTYKSILRLVSYGVSDFVYFREQLIILFADYCFILGKNDFKIIGLPAETLKISVGENGFLIGTFKGCYRYDEQWNLKESYLETNAITSCLTDKSGGIWLTTLEEGLFYAKSSVFNTYVVDEKIRVSPKKLIIDSGWVACSTEDKFLHVFSRNGTTIDRFDAVVCYKSEFGIQNKNNIKKLSTYLGDPVFFKERPGFYYYYSEHNGSRNYISNNRLKLSDVTTDTLYFFDFQIPSDNDYYFKNDSNVFIATDSGIFVYENLTRFLYYSPADKYKSRPVIAITPFRAGVLTILKNPFDMVYFNLEDSTHVSLADKNLKLPNTIYSIRVKNDSTLWLASGNGLLRASIGNNFEYLKVSKVSTGEGLINNEILSLELFNDTVWVGTKRGICFFPDDKAIYNYEEIPEFFNMDSILVNTTYVCQTTDTLEVDYGDEIDFYFKQISFSENEKMRYRYKFSHGNDSWSMVNSGQIDYLSRSPGYLELVIQPVCSHCKSSEIRLVIYTNYPFWYQWWFYTIILIGLSLIIWLVAKFIAHRRTIKKEKQIDKLKLEMRSLLSQMNPHFMFNTINAIQHYVVNHSAKDAVLYLADFALLIRRTLEYSRSEFISLAEELDFLKLYAELENKRFAAGFDIQFQLKLQTSAREIVFPSLLLQPLVENAIIHGISSQKKGEGQIIVSITETVDYFSISVLDNGDGFVSKKQSFDRKSFGMDILKNRVRLYNGSRFAETDIQFTDRHSGNVRGTEVKLILYKQQHESTDY